MKEKCIYNNKSKKQDGGGCLQYSSIARTNLSFPLISKNNVYKSRAAAAAALQKAKKMQIGVARGVKPLHHNNNNRYHRIAHYIH